MKKLLLLSCLTILMGCEKKVEAPPPPPPGSVGKMSVEFPIPGKDPAHDVVPAKPADFTLTAAEYHAEYKKDAAATKAKYKGKTLELSGTVNSFATNFSGDVQMLLDVPGDFLGVSCFTRSKQPWDIAMPGQQVKIRGEFPELIIRATLVKCDIVEVTGPKVPPLAAEELGTAFDKDKSATEKQYKGKTLLLTGTIAERKVDKNDGVRLIFKTTSKVKVIANIPPIDKDQAKNVKVGDAVRFVGQFDSLFYDDDEVGIGMCINAGAGK